MAVGLFTFLGKVWASRITESEKASHLKEIERLKSALEQSREDAKRLLDARFQLYTDVWSKLEDVRMIGDRLWQRVSEHDLCAFFDALTAANVAVGRGRIILHATHYAKLKQLLAVFAQYDVGKQTLQNLKSADEVRRLYNPGWDQMIHGQIEANRQNREEYSKLLDEILEEFQSQLNLWGPRAT